MSYPISRPDPTGWSRSKINGGGPSAWNPSRAERTDDAAALVGALVVVGVVGALGLLVLSAMAGGGGPAAPRLPPRRADEPDDEAPDDKPLPQKTAVHALPEWAPGKELPPKRAYAAPPAAAPARGPLLAAARVGGPSVQSASFGGESSVMRASSTLAPRNAPMFGHEDGGQAHVDVRGQDVRDRRSRELLAVLVGVAIGLGLCVLAMLVRLLTHGTL